MVADVRLRRDGGALCLFAAVLDDTPFPAGETNAVPRLFGAADGVELLLGPAQPAERRAPAVGDPRIFRTATRTGPDQLQGAAFACQPAAAGKHQTELTPTAGALVVVRERLDGAGYRIDAELPSSLWPELTAARALTFTRKNKIKVTADRLDLTGPVRLNLAVWRAQPGGAARRSAWVADGFAGVDPAAMVPSRWGAATLGAEATP